MKRQKAAYYIATILWLGLGLQTCLADTGPLPISQTIPDANPPALLPTKNVVGQTPLQDLLDFVNHPSKTSLCQGYYVEAPITFTPMIPNQTVAMKADYGDIYPDKPSTYLGNVVLTQATQEMRADKAVTYLDKSHKTVEEIKATGDVRFRESGMLAVANRGDIQVTKKTATFYEVAYRLLRSKTLPQAVTADGKTEYQVTGLSARGVAKVAYQTQPNHYTMKNATYSSCMPNDNSWDLYGKTLYIDNIQKSLTAYNAFLTVNKVPVFYTPYVSFSYDNARKSGFLLPVPSYSDRSGFGLAWPYYWNIAPNYDALFTPGYYTNRGEDLIGDIRYLTWQTTGEVYFNVLPYDRYFANFRATANADYAGNPGLARVNYDSNSRGYFSWQNQYVINPYWLSQTNFNYVSDDYFFQDFGNSPADTALSELQQQTNIQYNGKNWTFLGMLENYQTLHPINTNNLGVDQYARWPQFDLNADYPNLWGGLEYDWQNELVNFVQPLMPAHYPVTTNSPAYGPTPIGPGPAPSSGQRINTQPELSLPESTSWGYIKPDLQLMGTQYKLSGIPSSLTTMPDPSDNMHADMSRALSIFDIDSGLYFDRSLTIGSKPYTQTFEPRLFYLNVPMVNQNNFPIFDTTESLFNYDSVFQTNRYEGIDRISNANQLGFGGVSHLISNQDGSDQLDFDMGEIWYFEPRKVPLCQAFPGQTCTPSPNDSTAVSPIANDLVYHVNNAVTVSGTTAWNPNYRAMQNDGVNLSYQGDSRHIFNVGYSYQRYDALDYGNVYGTTQSNLDQISASTYWPINFKWGALGAITYNLNTNYAIQTYTAGLEYNTCCWAARAVMTRSFLYLNPQNQAVFDNEYYVQFILKSFTSLGSNTTGNYLSSVIPGFVDNLATY